MIGQLCSSPSVPRVMYRDIKPANLDQARQERLTVAERSHESGVRQAVACLCVASELARLGMCLCGAPRPSDSQRGRA